MDQIIKFIDMFNVSNKIVFFIRSSYVWGRMEEYVYGLCVDFVVCTCVCVFDMKMVDLYLNELGALYQI